MNKAKEKYINTRRDNLNLLAVPDKALIKDLREENGKLLAYIDELEDTIQSLKGENESLKGEISDILNDKSEMKRLHKEVKREELYQNLLRIMAKQRDTMKDLRKKNKELVERICLLT